MAQFGYSDGEASILSVIYKHGRSQRHFLTHLVQPYPLSPSTSSEIMEASIKAAAEKAKNHGIDLSKLPQNLNMNADSITANVHAMNASCE